VYPNKSLQNSATHCNTLHSTLLQGMDLYTQERVCIRTNHCNTLQHTATHCNTLQHTATHCTTLLQGMNLYTQERVCIRTNHCNALHHATPLYTTLFQAADLYRQESVYPNKCLQHTATHCNILQHTAPPFFKEEICIDKKECVSAQVPAPHCTTCTTLCHEMKTYKQESLYIQSRTLSAIQAGEYGD